MDGPDLPECCSHLWAWFMDAHQARQSGMSTLPLSWSDLHAFLSLHEIRLRPWEIRCLRAFDRAYLTAFAQEDTNDDGPGEAGSSGGQHRGEER